MWLKWRSKARKSPWNSEELDEHEVVQELAEFMGYSGAVLGDREATAKGKLVAVKLYHRQLVPEQVIASKQPERKETADVGNSK